MSSVAAIKELSMQIILALLPIPHHLDGGELYPSTAQDDFARNSPKTRTRRRVLNESNSRCYLRYRKHNPTTDINTFNATAFTYI